MTMETKKAIGITFGLTMIGTVLVTGLILGEFLKKQIKISEAYKVELKKTIDAVQNTKYVRLDDIQDIITSVMHPMVKTSFFAGLKVGKFTDFTCENTKVDYLINPTDYTNIITYIHKDGNFTLEIKDSHEL